MGITAIDDQEFGMGGTGTSAVAHAGDGPRTALAAGVTSETLIAPLDGSPLALTLVRLDAGATTEVAAAAEQDLLLFVFAGEGTARIDGAGDALVPGTTLLLAAGERAMLAAGSSELVVARFAVAHAADDHAPLGERVRISQLDLSDPDAATGSRSFQVLLGPENGCCRATLFVGVVPPGAAPWHFHQYDEIVLILSGHGRYHQTDGSAQALRAGSAVRIRPRDVHINENGSDGEMLVLGVFTPAGSPSAAYLAVGDGLPPHPSAGA